MLQFKGLVEKEIGGKKVFFKFNMAALTLFGDLQGLSFAEIGIELANPKLSSLSNLMYAAAKTYDRQEKPKEPQNYSQDDATEWVAELGFGEALNFFNEAFEVPEEKNGQAPTEAGPK